MEKRRATRYPIVAPAAFRARRGPWLEATTVDMSHLGLALRTQHTLPATGTRVRVRIALTFKGPREGLYVTCSGQVVRSNREPGGEGGLLAITIDGFRFVAYARDRPHSTLAGGAKYTEAHLQIFTRP